VSADTVVTLKGDCRLSTNELDQAARVDDRAVSELLERAATGEDAAERMLREWCGRSGRPRAAVDLVRALARCAERHHAPELFWTLRCQVLFANRRKRGKEPDRARDPVAAARHRWHWRFPNDLEQEGWDADVRLWAACRDWPPARRCERLLATGRSMLPLVALAHALVERPVPDLKALLLKAFQQRCRRPTWRDPTDPAELQHFWRLVQAAIALRDRDLAQALVDLIACSFDPATRIRLLGALISAGHGGARSAVLELTRDPREGDSEVRARAMATALAPARTAAFDSEASTTEAIAHAE
jgi:hypothetical protein